MSDDAEFAHVLYEGLSPDVVGEGPGWQIIKFTERCYNVILNPDDLEAHLAATLWMQKQLKIKIGVASTTNPHPLPDGRVSVCLLEKE